LNPKVRNKIKLSVVPVAIAWMIIFMHGVIPHNHQQEHKGDCNSVIHCCHDSEPGDVSIHFNETTHNDHHHLICHFNSGLYNHIDTDNHFLKAEKESFLPPADEIFKTFIISSCSFAEQDRHTPDNRRGPPSLRA